MKYKKLVQFFGIILVLFKSACCLGIRYRKNTTELIIEYGYEVHTYTLVTEDGYILSVHHMPNRLSKNSSKGHLLIGHGMTGSSVNFVKYGPKRSLTYYMVDRGYDVWLCNFRGSDWSYKHKIYDPSDKEFWDFSWHEIGYYDVAATIDFVIKASGHPKVFFLGHSQGATLFYALMSTRPEYNDKIRLSHHFGPPVLFKNWQNTNFQKLCSVFDMVEGMDQIRPDIVTSFIKGAKYLSMGTTPREISTRQLLHYGQVIGSGIFRQFNYGKTRNLEKYNSETPPEYDISKVTSPVALYYGDLDFSVMMDDVKELTNSAKHLALNFSIPNFGHLDFMLHKDIKSLIYQRMVDVMDKY